METAFVKVLVDSGVVDDRVYSSIPLTPVYPLLVYEITDFDPLTTRVAANDTPAVKTKHGAIDTFFSYLMRLEIVGQDRNQVRTTKDALLPFINGFNGESNGDELAIMVDSYRMEGQNVETNHITGVYDLSVYHKGA